MTAHGRGGIGRRRVVMVQVCLAAATGSMPFAASARMQPDPPPAESKRAAPTPAEVLRKVAERYRKSPWCERVNVEVRTETGAPDGGGAEGRSGAMRTSRAAFVLRVDPRVSGGTGEPNPVVVLELGPIRIRAADGTFEAVHIHNAATVFRAPVSQPPTSSALAALLPPLPLPSLDVMWNGASAESVAQPPERHQIAHYARSVVWTDAAPDPRSSGRLTLRGTCEGGSVSMTVQNDTIQSLDMKFPDSGTTIRIVLTRVAPCRDDEFRLDSTERSRVDRLADLQPRAGLLRLGAAVPELPITFAGGGGSGATPRLEELYKLPAENFPLTRASRLVLILLRGRMIGDHGSMGGGGGGANVRSAVNTDDLARALSDLQAQSLSRADAVADGLQPFNFAEVIIWDAPPAADELLRTLKGEQDVWGERLYWTTEPKATIDLFALPDESVAIVLDSGRRLAGVVPLSKGVSTEQVLDQISILLLAGGAGDSSESPSP